MSYQIVKIRCEKCGHTKVINVLAESDEDQDLLAADAGEFVERHCTTCKEVTDHEVLGE
jgi:phage FluMu protein Com